jgi:hypothetical protein
MRLHVLPETARTRLAAALEAAGGMVVPQGELLQLSYPTGDATDQDQEQMELLFFIRAWVATERPIRAEIVG